MAAALAAASLAAAAVGGGFSVATDLPWPDTGAGRTALAALGAAIVIALLVVLVRDDEPRLWLPAAGGAAAGGPAGGVQLPASALERAAEEAVAGHPDVLRAVARASGDARRLRIDVRVAARPFVAEAAVGGELARRVEEAVRPLLGPLELEIRTRVRGVRMGRLARYLP